MDGIDDRLAAWLERQPVFSVATAPLADRNAVSIDGLPAWPLDEPVVS